MESAGRQSEVTAPISNLRLLSRSRLVHYRENADYFRKLATVTSQLKRLRKAWAYLHPFMSLCLLQMFSVRVMYWFRTLGIWIHHTFSCVPVPRPTRTRKRLTTWRTGAGYQRATPDVKLRLHLDLLPPSSPFFSWFHYLSLDVLGSVSVLPQTVRCTLTVILVLFLDAAQTAPISTKTSLSLPC